MNTVIKDRFPKRLVYDLTFETSSAIFFKENIRDHAKQTDMFTCVTSIIFNFA